MDDDGSGQGFGNSVGSAQRLSPDESLGPGFRMPTLNLYHLILGTFTG